MIPLKTPISKGIFGAFFGICAIMMLNDLSRLGNVVGFLLLAATSFTLLRSAYAQWNETQQIGPPRRN